MKKKEKKKLVLRIRKFTVLVFLLDVVVMAGLVVINTDNFKTFWIPTAMTTMSHKYWAYTLYGSDTINEVMSENYIEKPTEEINLNDIVIGDTSEKKHYSSKYEEELYTRDPGNDLYKIIRLEEKNIKVI